MITIRNRNKRGAYTETGQFLRARDMSRTKPTDRRPEMFWIGTETMDIGLTPDVVAKLVEMYNNRSIT